MAIEYWTAGHTDAGALGNAANWSGSGPAVSNDFYIEHEATEDIDSDLDISADGTMASFNVSRSMAFALGSATAYAQLRCSESDIGYVSQFNTKPQGSQRIKIDYGNVAVACRVHGSSSGSTETNEMPNRFLFNSASSTLTLMDDARVGVASTTQNETSTLGTITMLDSGCRLVCGPGVTLTTLQQNNGESLLQNEATTVNVDGGACQIRVSDNPTIATLTGSGTIDLRGSTLTVTNSIELGDGAVLDVRDATLTLNGTPKIKPLAGWHTVTIISNPDSSLL